MSDELPDSAAGRIESTRLVPAGRRERWLLSCVIVAFFSFHLCLSLRGALLQDDRYGWRMFHNVGFTKMDYAWILDSGRKRRFTPKKKDIVARGHGLVLSNRRHFRTTLYSTGAAHESIKDYVRYMGQPERRPPGAIAFEGTLQIRINQDKKVRKYVYRYPEATE